MKITVTRKSHFNAAHRLYRPDWDEQRNNAVYGKCANANYHGHNYNLLVHVRGEVDADTGYVVDLKWLAGLIDRCVVERFDHQNLNLDTAEFKTLVPTAENIAQVIWAILRPEIDPAHDLKVTLYETERNYVECEG
ncbi:MAG: 6-pyruvoyl trahydropterin synthase family protein [Bacteroidia bacterium]